MKNPHVFSNKNPCKGFMSDLEFLEHMIPHHQIAIDMSNVLLPTTSDPNIALFVRNIIWNQQQEIYEMTNMINSHIPNMGSCDDFERNIPYMSSAWYTAPDLATDKKAQCDPHHFVMAHTMKFDHLTDTEYLENMIPHHQVAVDMSQRVLRYTTNPMIMKLAKEIIVAQQNEILLMNVYLQERIPYHSPTLRY